MVRRLKEPTSPIPASGAPVAPLVRRNDVKARVSERQHHLAPAVGKFGKTMEQENTRAVLLFEAGLQNVHAQALHAVNEAGADPASETGFR